MQEVALITDVDNEKQEDINKVTLMTVHSAKGLEFNYVFVVGMEENLFPSVISGESQENIEEERRLFYVAITRAKKRLFLSFSNQRFRWGQFIDCEPSRFLYELNDEYIEKKEMSSPKKHNYKPYRIFPNKQKKVKQYPKTPKNLTPLKKLETRTNAGEKFQIGMTVQHNRFGKGKLLDIDGKGSNEKATVFFEKAGQKQLLLKFAKLTIIN